MKAFSPILVLTLFLFACGTAKKAEVSPVTTPDTIEDNPAVKQGRIKDGADFYATGNEPFWSLSIDFEGSMHYITAEGFELTVPAVKGEKAMDAHVTRYHSETDKGTLTVQVFTQFCEDTMSGKKNNFKVQVEVKKRGDSVAETVTGCGNYLGVYEINDVWTLQRIGSKDIDTADKTLKSPTMELRLNDNRVLGLGGCNRYSGSFSLEGDKMIFGYMLSTMMACPGMSLESQFLKLLNEKTLPYKLEKGVLYVGTGENMMTFKRAEKQDLK
ncbi:META domain-containing protein [Pedobacter immunditicola]|uniref:META domain-containing protein n=1 Tax=Pedobacter immunditicola TaxID=3133440 RepID=UPI0030A775FA